MPLAFALIALATLLAPAAPAEEEVAPSLPAPAAAPGPPAAAQEEGSAAGSFSREFWSDPQFQKMFLGTYGVLGEVEPRLGPEERATLEQILPLMGTDLPGAAARLASAASAPGASALFDFTLGNVEFQQGRLEESAAAYRAAIEKFPSFLRAHKNRGLVAVRRGDMEEAARAITRTIELGGGDALSYGLLGQAYASLQDPLSAESAFRQAILLQPGSLEWKLGLLRALFRQQKYGEVVALSGELLEAHPDRAELWLLQANAFVGRKEPLRAAENYEMVARMGRATPEILAVLGDVYVNESLLDLASDAYGRAVELDSGGSPARALRAVEILAGRGGMEPARALLDRIRAAWGDRLSESDRRQEMKLRARIAMMSGSGEDVVRSLEEIVAADPLDGDALILLARHHARSGDPERAAFYFERAESLEAFEADAKVGRAQLLVTQERFGEAVPLLRRAQELRPREEVARYLDQVERVARSRR